MSFIKFIFSLVIILVGGFVYLLTSLMKDYK